MSRTKIALVGKTDFIRDSLFNLLTENGLDASFIDSDNVDLKDTALFNQYDLLILDAGMAENGETEFFSFIISTRDILIVNSVNKYFDIPVASSCYINQLMGPEEILSRINDVIFRKSNIRKSPRVNVEIDVYYESNDKIHRSRILNVSMNGLFITTLNPPPKGSLIKLYFSLKPGEHMVEAIGRVLYNIGYDIEHGIISHPVSGDRKINAVPGMGIVFEEISPAHKEAIRAFIEERAV